MKLLFDSKDLQEADKKYHLKNISGMYEPGLYKLYKFFCFKSFYSVSADRGNNIFKLDGSNAITIPDGNYSVVTFTTYLQTQLKLIDINFTVTYSATNNKITIANTSNFSIDWASTSCRILIGFPDNLTGLSTAALSIVSTHQFNFAGWSRLNIHMQFNQNIKTSNGSNILYALYNTNRSDDGFLYNINDYDKDIINIQQFGEIYFTFDNQYTKPIQIDDFVIEFIKY